jgi:hypothetical protein
MQLEVMTRCLGCGFTLVRGLEEKKLDVHQRSLLLCVALPLLRSFSYLAAFVNGNYLVLRKPYLDGAVKDKKHKKFPSSFSCELFFERVCGGMSEEDYVERYAAEVEATKAKQEEGQYEESHGTTKRERARREAPAVMNVGDAGGGEDEGRMVPVLAPQAFEGGDGRGEREAMGPPRGGAASSFAASRPPPPAPRRRAVPGEL